MNCNTKTIFVFLVFLFLSSPCLTAQRHGYRPYERREFRTAPAWHSSGLFEKRDLMGSMLYGAFGVRFDWIDMEGERITAYGGYLEYCNAMLGFSYGTNQCYKAYDASASFLIPFHPNFRFGPRIEYASMGLRSGGFDTDRTNIGLALDIHISYLSLTASISRNHVGFGFGWAFGRL